MARNPGFRAWFYFRNGWSLYFGFIFAAINTLTVTFYLAIDKYPDLSWLFPTFFHIESENYDFSSLPFFHAILNGSTAMLLITGFVLIKNKRAKLHKISMLWNN